MRVEELNVPVPWGHIRGQIFGDSLVKNTQPILCLHGYLDNSNSFKPIAPYLTRANEYYLVAIDFPGHGFSSKIPDGTYYSMKMLVSCVRRVVRHLKLKRFYFMCHSYGINIAFLYQTIFKDELIATISFDWIPLDITQLENIAEYWKKGIDDYINNDNSNQSQSSASRPILTKESALQILLKINPYFDTASAQILLERGLIVDENGQLQFSRDRRAKETMASEDILSEFVLMRSFILKAQKQPHLIIHAEPPYAVFHTEERIKQLKEEHTNDFQVNGAQIETIYIDGTHHFHMMKPQETADLVIRFLDRTKLKSNL